MNRKDVHKREVGTGQWDHVQHVGKKLRLGGWCSEGTVQKGKRRGVSQEMSDM